MNTPKRPTLVDAEAPAEKGAAPERSPTIDFAREALALIKAEAGAHAPAPAGGGPPSRQVSAPLLVVLALGGAFLVQRTESTREIVTQSVERQAEISAQLGARLDAQEAAQARADTRATKSEETLREAFWILSEDSRANWDALGQIHESTKPAGAPSLRAPATAARLSNLREALAKP